MKSKNQFSQALCILNTKFRHLCSRIRWLIWRRPRSRVVIKKFGKLYTKNPRQEKKGRISTTQKKGEFGGYTEKRPIRIATFNVAMFSLAPAISEAEKSVVVVHEAEGKNSNLRLGNQINSVHNQPKSILKQSPLHPVMNGTESLSNQISTTKSRLKVSINLPENEISLSHNHHLVNLAPTMRSPVCFPAGMFNFIQNEDDFRTSKSILDVLREVDADILALQDVKAEEEKNMTPLSDLARVLGMNYVFAESWAPAYGNAIFSKWPIKRWRVQKIFDDQDFRNVLRATIDVPHMGEINFLSTQLDHLDENWRMKQINAIIQSNDGPHILAGGLNSLDGSDYSVERWADIVKYYEQIGKPTPKIEVMKYLNGKGYKDAKDFAGECEPVVIIAKGQSVQGTCKYGTRVDYVMASQDLPYKFVPGSYSVISSKGTSDHHLVKVEIVVADQSAPKGTRHKVKQQVVRIKNACSNSKGIWKIRD